MPMRQKIFFSALMILGQQKRIKNFEGEKEMKPKCFLLMLVLIMCSIARAATINFDVWPDGSPITAPTDLPYLSITDEFAVWGIIFESTTKIHQHSTPADLPTPPNALISDHFEDSITLDARFVDPENPTIDGTVTWVEFTQDRGAQSGGGTFIAYDICGNKVIEQSFNTSGKTFHWEHADGIHRIYIGSCYDSLDDLTFGEVTPEPACYTWHTYNGHQYALTLCVGTWQQAEAEAVAVGGHLVTINDAAEHAWLGLEFEQQLDQDEFLWIGFYQDHDDPDYSEPAGGWKWISGEPVTYLGWDSPEPTNHSPGEDYGTITGSTTNHWNDWGPERPDFYPIHGIIEISEPAGPVAYWSFDDASNPGRDDSGNGNDGIVYGAVSSEGVCDNALSFDGNGDYANFGNTIGNFGTADFSVVFWFRSDAERKETVMGKRVFCGEHGFFELNMSHPPAPPGHMLVEIYEGYPSIHGSFYSNQRLDDNQWHLLAITRQGVQGKLYIDGFLDASRSAAKVINMSNSASFLMGNGPCYPVHSDFFSGELDEVRIYDRALSACEIAELASEICEPACGWIAFASWQDGDADIWAVRPDGTGLRQLTNMPGSEFTPQWSPDSTRIAYDTAGDAQLWVYDWFTGSNNMIYESGQYSTSGPVWSPDGTKILFREDASYNNPHITVINADGTGRQIVPVQSGYVSNPSWSPSGTAFVYEKRNSGASYSNDLWIYDFTASGNIMNGTNIRLTAGAGSESTTKISPDWRPGGDIVLSWGHNLVTINPGESPTWREPPISDLSSPYVTILTDDASYPSLTYWGPSWSPDQCQIVYWYYYPGGGVDDLWIMDAAGGNRNPLTSTPYRAEWPDWGNPVCNTEPVAICQDVTVEADSNCEGIVLPEDVNDGSFDPDGDVITLSLEPGGPYPLGETTVTLTVSDGEECATCEATVTVEDVTPPEITCPGDVTVEQESYAGTVVPLEATATDNCDANPAITSDELAVYPLGVTMVTFTATDASGNSASCSMTVTVIDTTAPTIHSVSASPNILWPPNHKMVEVVVVVDAEDICDPLPVCQIVDVTSNEPINGSGDGDTTPDWEITGDLMVNLRSERAGAGSGRVYSIHIECTDASGNTATATVEVTMPHDQGKEPKSPKK